jgi:muramoyltetrapeptide carboxypeptidase
MIVPKSLRPNDLVLVVSPAFAPDPAETEAGIQSLIRAGLRVEMAPNALKKWGSFAGSDEERFSDLQWALDHPEAKMIISSRGGYGTGRIFRQLNFSGFHQNPKWFTGFSDLTVLHYLLQKEGFASMHGPMLVHYSRLPELAACMKEQDFLIRHQPIKYSLENSFPDQNPDGVQGIVVGGTLSLLDFLLPHLDDAYFDGRILFLEELSEAFHKIDRMLDKLLRSGKCNKLSAIVLGTFQDCPVNGFPLEIPSMLREKIGPEIPVFSGLPCGHKSPSMPLILGYQAEIRQNGAGWEFSQKALPLISAAG